MIEDFARAIKDIAAVDVLGSAFALSDPFEGVQKNHYQVIYADPPWRFETFSDKGRGRCPDGDLGHYDTASLDYLKALPVGDLAAPDCALFMWVLDTMVQEALDLGRAWGFTHKTTAFYWSKMKKNASIDLLKPNTIDQLFPIGTGYWTRANPETCMLFTKGSPDRKARNVRRLVNAPRREHSRKPDEVYDRIERLVDGPYLELFARQTREGWDSWGNETEKFDVA